MVPAIIIHDHLHCHYSIILFMMAQTKFQPNSGGPGWDVFTYLCILHANIVFYAKFCITGQQDCSLARWARYVAYLSGHQGRIPSSKLST